MLNLHALVSVVRVEVFDLSQAVAILADDSKPYTGMTNVLFLSLKVIICMLADNYYNYTIYYEGEGSVYVRNHLKFEEYASSSLAIA